MWSRIIIIVLFTVFKSQSQGLLPFKSLRYDEDYSLIEKDSSTTWYHNMKYSRLGKTGAFVSFGGEIRYQYFYTKNEEWGDAPPDDDGYTLTRWLTHADLHFGRHVRTFFQLQSSFANSRPSPSPVDDNPLEIHQAFFDFNTASNKIILRIGRQELSYGSQRLVSTREGPNNRQSFDVVRSIMALGKWRSDIFYGSFFKAQSGIFDDKFNNDITLWGMYFVRNRVFRQENIDLYYLGLEKSNTTFNEGKGKERRHSIGTRVWNSNDRWHYDIEAAYQFGDFSGNNISAWTASSNLTYLFKDMRFSPEVGLKTELISGDKREDDGKLQTFNPLFPRGAYFGLVALIGPANLFDIHPSISVNLTDELSIDFDYDVFWRYASSDGLYAVNVSLLYPADPNAGKHIGNQLATSLVYSPNNFLFFRWEFTWFNCGEYLNAVSAGKDIIFSGVTARLTF
jgi:hypothetical protein